MRLIFPLRPVRPTFRRASGTPSPSKPAPWGRSSSSASLAFLVSGVLHVAILLAAHSLLRGWGAVAWPAREGVSSLELQGSFAQVGAEEPLPQVAMTLVTEAELSHEGLHEVPAAMPRVETPVTNSRMPTPPAEMPEAAWIDRPLPQRASGSEEKSAEISGISGGRAERVAARPPATSSMAALESHFSAGELRKSLPQPRYNPAPVYPPQLLAERKSGLVLLRVDIDVEGCVAGCSVHESSGHAAFDAAALTAVRGWKFEPAMRFGIPVATRILCPIRFQFMDLPPAAP